MNPRTHRLLKLSIAHWERMRKDKTKDSPGAIYCPLCKEFYRNECEDCPICQETGMRYCKGTPYDIARESYFFGDKESWEHDAQAEIDFLKSLLPKP